MTMGCAPSGRRQYGSCVKRHKMRTHDRELHSLLVLDSGSAIGIASACARRRDKVRRVDLDFVVALRAELLDRFARLVRQVLRLDESEADADAGRVVDSVGAGFDGRGGVRSGAGFEDEVERVVGIELQAGKLRRGVVHRVRDGSETLTVAVDREVDERGRCEVKLVPFEGDLRSKGKSGAADWPSMPIECPPAAHRQLEW